MKYENLAKVGDVIRAYDFQYTRACYLEGRVIAKGMIMHPKYEMPLYDGYTIEVTVDSGRPGVASKVIGNTLLYWEKAQ